MRSNITKDIVVHIRNGKGELSKVYSVSNVEGNILDNLSSPFINCYFMNTQWGYVQITPFYCLFKKPLVSENDDCVEVNIDLIHNYDCKK